MKKLIVLAWLLPGLGWCVSQGTSCLGLTPDSQFITNQIGKSGDSIQKLDFVGDKTHYINIIYNEELENKGGEFSVVWVKGAQRGFKDADICAAGDIKLKLHKEPVYTIGVTSLKNCQFSNYSDSNKIVFSADYVMAFFGTQYTNSGRLEFTCQLS